MISCYCITYDRAELLIEAIESFHLQDYKGKKELVILNDCPEQTLKYEHPEVYIINTPKRFRTIGEKRNACIAMCSGDVIFAWDDDDISLPWRITTSLKYKKEHPYFKNKRAWVWSNGEIRDKPVYNTYPSMACWDREFFEEVNGYAFMQSGQDIELDNRFRKTGKRYCIEIPDKDVYYIYRFGGTRRPHLSSYGYGKGWIEIGKRKIEEVGVIELNPHWKEDYVESIKLKLNLSLVGEDNELPK
jgi:glycosyltransferase involved in cell wall biosynthesis